MPSSLTSPQNAIKSFEDRKCPLLQSVLSLLAILGAGMEEGFVRLRPKQGFKAYLKNIWDFIAKGPVLEEDTQAISNELWNVPIRLTYGDTDEHRPYALALFDSQSPFDMIATRFAAKLGLNYYNVARKVIGRTITGDDILGVGEITARWYCDSSSWRIEAGIFQVVATVEFDVKIGHPTLNDLHLYERNNLIVAPYRPLPSNAAASASKIKEEQREWEERRKSESLKVKADEEQRVRKPSTREICG
ncbi:hypothetical protein GQ44DRAFT_807824 [Phaeosphaeriaceae sp. PMI808]|nr:hypothetical protein GQ44DRAFT_807824 [Phaeosphaeriaceae sp. PMI808]